MSGTTEPSKTPLSSRYIRKKWELPEGIEGHIESGVVKVVIGVMMGGMVETFLFKSGNKRMKLTGVALGLGAAVGSTFQRFKGNPRNK